MDIQTKYKSRSIKSYLRDCGLGFELPNIELCIMDGVYQPRLDSFLLAKHLLEVVNRGDKVLDLGTGSGILAVLAAVKGAIVTATDIDKVSVECTRYNALLNKVTVDTYIGDLFEPIGGESFDVIVSNMPSLPSPADEQHDEYTMRNVDGGRDGRKYLDPLMEQALRFLKKPCCFLIIHSNFANSERTKKKLENLGFEAEVKEYEFPIGIDSEQRVDYFIKRLPPNCHPFKRAEIWYQRMDVFKAFPKRNSNASFNR